MIKRLLFLLLLASSSAFGQVTTNCTVTGVANQGCPFSGTTITATTGFRAAAGSVGAPSYSFTANTNDGIWNAGGGKLDFSTSGIAQMEMQSNSIRLINTTALGFTAGDPTAGGNDVAISRISPGVVGVGTGAQGSVAGTVQTANVDSGAASNLVLKYNGTATVTIGAANTPITVAGLTTGTNADVLCLTAGGVVVIQAAASCTISSVRFKRDVAPIDGGALDRVLMLQPVAFNMKENDEPNPDNNYARRQIGFTAENIAEVDPRMVIYEQDGVTPKAYREGAVMAMAVQAIKEQQAQIAALTQQVQELKAMKYTSSKGVRHAKHLRLVATAH